MAPASAFSLSTLQVFQMLIFCDLNTTSDMVLSSLLGEALGGHGIEAPHPHIQLCRGLGIAGE